MNTIEIQYTTTIDDYLAYCHHTIRMSKAARQSRLVSWFGPSLACLGGAVALAIVGHEAFALVAAFVGGAYALVYPLAYRSYIDSYLRSYARDAGTRGVVGPIKLILDDVKLVEITERTTTEARWKTMSGVVEVGDHTFIMVTGLSAAILPRRGFASDEDYYRVRDFARERIGQGDGSSVAEEF